MRFEEAEESRTIPEYGSARCPVCGGLALIELLDLGEVPVFCNVQSSTREEARTASTAPFTLVGCTACGHSFNSAFDPDLLEYAPSYDNSQHFSATFRAYADELATRLVETHKLHRVAVVDVGCGKGDLLKLLCRLGGNRGFGFDVSYEGDPEPADAPGVSFFTEFFDANKAEEISPSLVSCRHVLEHVPDPVNFLRELATALAAKPGSVLYIEVPNGELQLRERLVWDYIYEHYSYFSPTSLRYALESAGLQVIRLDTGFGGQFLCADVKLQDACGPDDLPAATGQETSADMFAAAEGFDNLLSAWRRWAGARADSGASTVLWGAGSKGVTFVNLLDLFAPHPVNWIVDQNPNKHGRFVARTGQEIVAPERLVNASVQTVLVMNAIYTNEITDWINSHDIEAQVIDAMSAPTTAPTG